MTTHWNRRSLLAIVVGLSVWAPALAADLSNVDRSIHKEPAYNAKPKYCLLVFGPEARTRVWLVLDGDVLYIDRNGTGDLTEAGKRVPLPAFQKSEQPVIAGERQVDLGDIREGPLTHTHLTFSQVRLRKDFKPKNKEEREFTTWMAGVPDGLLNGVSARVELFSPVAGKGRVPGRVKQEAYGLDDAGVLVFAATPKNAPVIHFNGPLVMGLQMKQVLRRGKTDTDLVAKVVTPGMGPGTAAYLVYATLPGLIPEGVHPVAEIKFPPSSPGAGPIKVRYVLKQRC